VAEGRLDRGRGEIDLAFGLRLAIELRVERRE
jgi:hypothetical protein